MQHTVVEHLVATMGWAMQKFPNTVGLKTAFGGLVLGTAIPASMISYGICRVIEPEIRDSVPSVIRWVLTHPSIPAVGVGVLSIASWIRFFKARTRPNAPVPPLTTHGAGNPTLGPASVKIVIISDTHSLHSMVTVPDGDILVHCGDFTKWGKRKEIEAFNNWLGTLPHRHKLVISGNHDLPFDKEFYHQEDGWKDWHKQKEVQAHEDPHTLLSNATYLQDSEVTVMGLRFYGCPWHPMLPSRRMAFARERDSEELVQQANKIPNGLDVLITHGPVYGQGDQSAFGVPVGCQVLRTAVLRARPRHVVCGHIHEAYGTSTIQYDSSSSSSSSSNGSNSGGVDAGLCINAATCTLGYKAHQPPIVLTIHKK